jgi:hypothetical protein
MRATKPEGPGRESGSDAEFAKCTGHPNNENQVAGIHSPDFAAQASGETVTVQSSVSVFSSPAAAARDFAIVRTAAGKACVTRMLKRSLGKLNSRRLRIGRPAFTWATSHIPGTQGSFAISIVLPLHLTGHRLTVPAYMDILAFASGPTEVALETFGLPRPVPTATEERLLTLLLQRAESR